MDPITLALACAKVLLDIIYLSMQKMTDVQFQANEQRWLDLLDFFTGKAGAVKK